ncbi:MAG: class I SAM-dependent methyltransferase [Acidobacteriota bacterium]
MTVIPFYGAQRRDLFAVERAAMDRQGHVLQALERVLPDAGVVLDVGAGDGFTAERLATPERRVLAMEPARGMIDPSRSLTWLRGDASALPLADDCVDGVVATWAYFFPSFHDITGGLAEAERVLRPGGVLAIVNNLGDDEFTALASSDISEPASYFTERGFELEVIETRFVFESLEDARELLGLYFGDRGREGARLELSYRVGLYTKTG